MIPKRDTRPEAPRLRRMIGGATVVCTGVGCAIGSGIFRTPSEVAGLISSPWVILSLWLIAGLLTLAQSLVTAELATRFPLAGGEYQYLKEAYGEFAAFFFGWSFTLFIVAGSGGTIGAALGEFAALLLGLDPKAASPALGCLAIGLVVAGNCIGLRAGAAFQNMLTILKTLALLAVAVAAWSITRHWTPIIETRADSPANSGLTIPSLISGLLLAFWPFTGATDPAKLAEETREVRRSMPRALIGTVVLLTVVYGVYNYALFCAMPVHDMAGHPDAHALVFRRSSLPHAETLILMVSILVCFGALSSAFLANTRVTFALARDRLTFRFLGGMSRGQSPVGSLISCGVIACFFVLYRNFMQILRIYYMGSTVLFGLTYLSLIIFRRRDRRAGRSFPDSAFRVPGGTVMAWGLCLIEAMIAVSLVYEDVRTWSGPSAARSYDSLFSVLVLIGLAILYKVWKRWDAHCPPITSPQR